MAMPCVSCYLRGKPECLGDDCVSFNRRPETESSGETGQRVVNEQGGVKNDGGKARWDLVPWGAACRILTRCEQNEDNHSHAELVSDMICEAMVLSRSLDYSAFDGHAEECARIALRLMATDNGIALLNIHAYWHGMDDVVYVLELGDRKYGAENWRNVERRRYVAAMWRHLRAYMRGERIDHESGKSPLAHVICCIMFLMELEKGGKDGNQ